MYIIKLENHNFEGKKVLTDIEYKYLCENLKQYYRKVNETDFNDDPFLHPDDANMLDNHTF